MGKYFKEDGKTFWDWGNGSGVYERAHDEKFNGACFKYKRCPFCKRLISQSHALHWMNHLEKCAPDFYTYRELNKLRWCEIKDLPNVNKKHSRKKQNF